MAQDDFSTGTVELEEAEVKVDRPPLFTVVIFNDDFTPMEFVVYVIQKFFGYDHAKSTEIMLQIHSKGRGFLWCIFSRNSRNKITTNQSIF